MSSKKGRKGYLHGYSSKEQERLHMQAEILEPWIYENIEFGRSKNMLEIGCGVGAQTAILLRRFPHLRITGVDVSSKQIAAARRVLSKHVKAGAVDLSVGDATALKFDDSTFDGAFICWLLEHVSDPVAILCEVLRTMRSGATIYCTEVQNSSLFLEPYSPATLKYWFEFNDQQWKMKGDPFVGAKLGNLLLAAGFQNIETSILPFHFDSRAPKQRAEFIKYWTDLLLSGAPALLRAGRVDKKLVAAMTRELKAVGESKESVFYYTALQAKARVL